MVPLSSGVTVLREKATLCSGIQFTQRKAQDPSKKSWTHRPLALKEPHGPFHIVVWDKKGSLADRWLPDQCASHSLMGERWSE